MLKLLTQKLTKAYIKIHSIEDNMTVFNRNASGAILNLISIIDRCIKDNQIVWTENDYNLLKLALDEITILRQTIEHDIKQSLEPENLKMLKKNKTKMDEIFKTLSDPYLFDSDKIEEENPYNSNFGRK